MSYTKLKPAGTVMLPQTKMDVSTAIRPATHEQILHAAHALCRKRASEMPGTFAALVTDESAAVHGATRNAIRDCLPLGVRLEALDVVALVRQGRLFEQVHAATGEVRYWPRGLADDLLVEALHQAPAAAPSHAEMRQAFQHLVDLLTAATESLPNSPDFGRKVLLAMHSLADARKILAAMPI